MGKLGGSALPWTTQGWIPLLMRSSGPGALTFTPASCSMCHQHPSSSSPPLCAPQAPLPMQALMPTLLMASSRAQE